MVVFTVFLLPWVGAELGYKEQDEQNWEMYLPGLQPYNLGGKADMGEMIL